MFIVFSGGLRPIRKMKSYRGKEGIVKAAGSSNFIKNQIPTSKIRRIFRALILESLNACGKGLPVRLGLASGVWNSGSSLCYAKIASLMIKPLRY